MGLKDKQLHQARKYTEHQPNLQEKKKNYKQLKKGDEASLHPIVLSH